MRNSFWGKYRMLLYTFRLDPLTKTVNIELLLDSQKPFEHFVKLCSKSELEEIEKVTGEIFLGEHEPVEIIKEYRSMYIDSEKVTARTNYFGDEDEYTTNTFCWLELCILYNSKLSALHARNRELTLTKLTEIEKEKRGYLKYKEFAREKGIIDEHN